jgi:hypothetical protein
MKDLLVTLSTNNTQHINTLYVECHVLFICCAECCCAECCCAESRYADCCCPECRCAECRCAECRYTECCGDSFLTSLIFMGNYKGLPTEQHTQNAPLR